MESVRRFMCFGTSESLIPDHRYSMLEDARRALGEGEIERSM